MSINENIKVSELELISDAYSSRDPKQLELLSKSVYMNVRKAVARNLHTSSTVINQMAQREITASVVYWLLKNPACQSNRKLSQEDLNTKCVTCDLPEIKLHKSCASCTL